MKNEQPLVSIIVPCYNVESWVDRFMESICAQTYRPIELIVINDGSTDRTGAQIASWEAELKQQGISFIYKYQENGGVSAAINTGLRYFTGTYLCWPDPDDALTPDSIAEKVGFLQENPGYPVVTSDAFRVSEEELDKPVGLVSMKNRNRFKEDQFLQLINERSIFCPLCHMMRRRAFYETHPTGQIFPSRFGQNWQMLLPVFYKYKRGFLDKPLGFYSVRTDSLSRGDDTLEKSLMRAEGNYEILVNTVKEIDMPEEERKRYLRHIEVRYARKRLAAGRRYHDKELMSRQTKRLKSLGALKPLDIFWYMVGSRQLADRVYQRVKKPVLKAVAGYRNRL